MKVPRLMSTRPMEGWLAMLRASSAIMSDALQQTKAAPIGVICKSASSAPHFLLARVQLSIWFPICLSRIRLASLYLCPADCVQDILFQQAGNSHWNKLGILTGTSWHFMAFLRHIKCHICLYLLRMKVPHLMSTRPTEGWLAMLRSSSAIMSDALQQTKAAPIGVICKSASSAPHFLLAGVQLSIWFPICLSRIRLAASRCLCPADCFQDILFQQAGNSHWNKLAFHGSSPTYQVTYLLISAPYESTSLDVNKANGRLTSNAKVIFCDNVRCFATNKSCSNRCHLQECFKCSSLLACKAARVQLSTCFPIYIVFLVYTLHLPSLRPADCFQ